MEAAAEETVWKKLVTSLYEYAIASPQPEQWLRNCVSAYEMPEDGTWEDFSGNEAVLGGLRTAQGMCSL